MVQLKNIAVIRGISAILFTIYNGRTRHTGARREVPLSR